MRYRFFPSLVPLYLLCCHAAFYTGVLASLINDEFINQILTDWNSPGGIAVAVVQRDNQGKWNIETKGFGIATANGSKVTENTLFAIGSNSKLFNILATGLLIKNETLHPRLDWTSKIASIIPGWGLTDPIAAKQATIIDVMSHRTGLPRHDFAQKWSDDVPTLIKKMKFHRPSAEFRDVFQYSNNMYALLSYLPPLLLPSKTPFARYVKEHIFDPLSMTSTTYSYDKARASGQLADGMAKQGIDLFKDPFSGTTRILPYWAPTGGEDGNLSSGDGGIISNAIDMATWLQTLLLEGVKPGTNQSVIPSDIIQKVSTGISIQTSEADFPELSPVVYGGGQSRSTYRGHEIIEHGGEVPGFNSKITRLPFDNLGVVVLSNDNDYGSLIVEVIRWRLLDDALGLEKVDWNSRYKAFFSTPPPPATHRPTNAPLPPTGLTSLAGVYYNPGYGTFEFCLVSPKTNAASSSCKALASNITTILPEAIDPDIPTFIARWDSPGLSHIRFAHFSGNIFNISGLTSLPTNNASEPFWTRGSDTSINNGALTEAVVDGGRVSLALTGIWSAGAGIPGPKGKTIRERAEVWFDKI